MFHFWFNTLFVKDEEQVIVNGRWTGSDPSLHSSYSNTNMEPVRLLSSVSTASQHFQVQHFQQQQQQQQQQQGTHEQSSTNHHDYHHQNSGPSNISQSSRQNRLSDDQLESKFPVNCQSPFSSALRQSVWRSMTSYSCKTLLLRKDELDKANKDKAHRIYNPAFTVSMLTVAIFLQKLI